MTETYEQFTKHVVDGREGIDISKTAEGRLFTGDKALELKMVDAIGGLDDAMHELAADVGLDDFMRVSLGTGAFCRDYRVGNEQPIARSEVTQ
jgi:ClpP class serine protease